MGAHGSSLYNVDVMILGVNVKPTSVCSELEALEDAYRTASNEFNTTDGFIVPGLLMLTAGQCNIVLNIV